MSDKVTISERYMHACDTSNLSVESEKRCDADLLLAAAYATRNDPDRSLALMMWRMKQERNTRHFDAVADQIEVWVSRRYVKRMQRMGSRSRETIRKTLYWWLDSTCKACEGLGHPVIAGTPHLDYSLECPHCRGTGQSNINGIIDRVDMRELSADIVSEINRLSAIVFSDMARLLAEAIVTNVKIENSSKKA